MDYGVGSEGYDILYLSGVQITSGESVESVGLDIAGMGGGINLEKTAKSGVVFGSENLKLDIGIKIDEVNGSVIGGDNTELIIGDEWEPDEPYVSFYVEDTGKDIYIGDNISSKFKIGIFDHVNVININTKLRIGRGNNTANITVKEEGEIDSDDFFDEIANLDFVTASYDNPWYEITVDPISELGYVFTIPATADLRTSVDGIVTYPIGITATTPVAGKSLVLTLESDADTTHEVAKGGSTTYELFSLKDSGSNYAYYKVGKVEGNESTPLKGKNSTSTPKGNTVLTLDMSTQSSVDGTLGFKTIELPSITGTYTGTLNFKITVTDNGSN